MKKISAFIFILLVSLSSLAFVVEAAQRPRALPLPDNNRLMLPSAKPTLQVQLSHSPILEDDDLKMTIRAKDDRGVKAISVASALLNQPIIESCQVNGRSPRTCEKGFVFRMPRGQQRFIITAVDDENQNAVKTVNVNVLAVNEDVDVRVTGPLLTPDDFEELPVEVELLVTIEGVAKGRLCYRADYEFPVQDGNERSTQEGSLFDCEDSAVRTRLNNGQMSYQAELEIELFEPFDNFEGVPGEYHADVEVWLEDENGRRVDEDNTDNNWYRVDRVIRDEERCEEQIDEALRNVGEQNEEVDDAIDRIADIDFQIWNTNPSEEELRELENQRRAALNQYEDKLQDARDEYEETMEQMQRCDFRYAPDLVITNVQQITPDPILQGSDGIEYEVSIENQGTATIYGPFDDQLWYGGYDSALAYSNRHRHPVNGLEPGEIVTLWAGVGLRDVMNTPGNYSFSIGIDTGIQVCHGCDVDYEFGRYNRIPESNEENNVYTVNAEIVAQ